MPSEPSPPFAAPPPCFGFILDIEDAFVREQICAQVLIELRIVSPEPFERHRSVFLFFVAVVREDFLELRVARGIDPLVVPVDRLELFSDRCDSSMTVDRRRRERFLAFVKACTAIGHGGPAVCSGSSGRDGAARCSTHESRSGSSRGDKPRR